MTNFRLSDKSLLDRIMLDRGVWWLLGGWVLFAASESVNGPASDPGCELNAGSCHMDFLALVMMHIFFVTGE